MKTLTVEFTEKQLKTQGAIPYTLGIIAVAIHTGDECGDKPAPWKLE